MHRLLLLLFIIPVAAISDDQVGDAKTNLFLTSAAINVLDELVPMLPVQERGLKDCYIVTAGNLDANPHWIDDEIDAIEDSGRGVRRVDLARLADDSLADAFDDCSVIWAGGGNTFYLLQEVRRSGFDTFLGEKLADGVPYVGTSAGSIILAPNIECVRYADDPAQAPQLTSFAGLNLFPLVALAHFDNPDLRDVYRKILMHALEHDVAFVTLRDNQFIHMEGDTWKIIDSL